MNIEDNKEVVRQLYMEVSSLGNQNVTGGRRGRGFTQYTSCAKPSSLKAFNRFFSTVSEAFPDYKLTIDNIIAKGDRVLTRYTICGTHQRDFMGMAPTYERLTVHGIDVFRLDNGKVVEHWDAAHQISAFPSVEQEPDASSDTRQSNRLTTTRPGRKQFSLST
jgi:predicted ester cyclase